ncbi:DUF4126 domain-containing protein [Sphingobacterium sp. HJSM2_6]|uniref:DUF4126 domain-containing protein n=1 Tax=Sphingobacterium sp. HJSM2_6 TaxID=3366264 RepID=UPI003BCDDEFE
MMTEYIPYLISLFVGVGLAAATGFRVFLPIFLISLGSYLGWFPLAASFSWMSGISVVIGTGIAMVCEIAAYYLPFIDNVLDSITVPLATVAGTILVAGQFTEINSFVQWALGLIAGGGTAATISAAMAGTRALSSSTTAGIANPIVSTVETLFSTIMSFISIFLPILAIVLVAILLLMTYKFSKKIWNKLQTKPKQPSSY